MVACNYLPELFVEGRVAVYGQLRGFYELVGYAAKCRYYDNHVFLVCRSLNNALEI